MPYFWKVSPPRHTPLWQVGQVFKPKLSPERVQHLDAGPVARGQTGQIGSAQGRGNMFLADSSLKSPSKMVLNLQNRF